MLEMKTMTQTTIATITRARLKSPIVCNVQGPQFERFGSRNDFEDAATQLEKLGLFRSSNLKIEFGYFSRSGFLSLSKTRRGNEKEDWEGDERSCKLRSYPHQCALVPNGFGFKRKLLLGSEISCPKHMIRTNISTNERHL